MDLVITILKRCLPDSQSGNRNELLSWRTISLFSNNPLHQRTCSFKSDTHVNQPVRNSLKLRQFVSEALMIFGKINGAIERRSHCADESRTQRSSLPLHRFSK